jgi:anaerobic ribonucleoside-triphosphate reductase
MSSLLDKCSEIENEKMQMKESLKVKIRKVPAEIYSRVVGYYRPVDQWNKGKKEEFNDRKPLKMEEICKKP